MFAGYSDLLKALKAKQDADLDVRIIVRGEFARGVLENMKTFGFRTDRDSIRLQERCHNKMMIVDDGAVLIGSHNWTNDGATSNRDASLLFRDPELSAYCAKVFDYDWQRVASARLREDGQAPRRAVAGERTPPGMYAASLTSLAIT